MQNKTLTESIAERIKQRIMIGEYAVGSQLPNEQVLSESLNVSRTTVREAVKLLISKHILEIERGRGTFVAAIPGLGEDPFGLEFVNPSVLRPALTEFRMLVEPDVCALAARNASAQQLEELAEIVSGMKSISELVSADSAAEFIDSFIDLELSFHELVYKMSHNIVFERMTDIIARSVVLNSTELNYRTTFDFQQYMEVHARLYDAIASRDPELVREGCQAHVKYMP